MLYIGMIGKYIHQGFCSNIAVALPCAHLIVQKLQKVTHEATFVLPQHFVNRSTFPVYTSNFTISWCSQAASLITLSVPEYSSITRSVYLRLRRCYNVLLITHQHSTEALILSNTDRVAMHAMHQQQSQQRLLVLSQDVRTHLKLK